jgi:hypothetical protein
MVRRTIARLLLLGLLGGGLSACSREYVLAALQGFERGAMAPVTSCRTTYASRGTRAASYTTCNTY